MRIITLFRSALLLFFIVITTYTSTAQESSGKLTFGFASELMTWINKGFHGSFWIGKNGLRARLVTAKAVYPNAFSPKGFKDLTSEFYEIEIDYFFGKKRNEFRGIWFAVGSGYTRQSVVSESSGQKVYANLFDLHSGIGYTISLYKGLYINPWIGVDLHLNRKEIKVGEEKWTPNFIDPVLGAKVGYSF